ncbi:MAG: hypothetical protein QNJ94_23900, partial [Alphaproteobacteria bacterium]|nr:hypothetical protein [Alphaproteobacteria bacterium]
VGGMAELEDSARKDHCQGGKAAEQGAACRGMAHRHRVSWQGLNLPLSFGYRALGDIAAGVRTLIHGFRQYQTPNLKSWLKGSCSLVTKIAKEGDQDLAAPW